MESILYILANLVLIFFNLFFIIKKFSRPSIISYSIYFIGSFSMIWGASSRLSAHFESLITSIYYTTIITGLISIICALILDSKTKSSKDTNSRINIVDKKMLDKEKKTDKKSYGQPNESTHRKNYA